MISLVLFFLALVWGAVVVASTTAALVTAPAAAACRILPGPWIILGAIGGLALFARHFGF